MRSRASKRPKREDEAQAQAAVRVIRTAVERAEGHPALVPGTTDEDPNTGRRIKKKIGVDPAVSAAAAALSKLGASKGGMARKNALTPKERTRIAKKAAAARWKR
jgi:predicted DsbA family dithiol-disulfide isomerase